MKMGWENVTATVIMRCFIRCGITRKCDYSAEVRAQHGLDSVKVSPVIADLVADEENFSARSVFVPNDGAPPPDEDEWMQDMGSIMDMNMDNEVELEMLQDLRSGYEDLQYARELELAEDTAEDSAMPASVAEQVVEAINEEDTIEAEAPPKKRIRFSREQVTILQRKFDRGTSRMSNRDIAVEIDMKPEGIGRKVVPDDVKNWMSAKTKKARSLAFLSRGAGQD